MVLKGIAGAGGFLTGQRSLREIGQASGAFLDRNYGALDAYVERSRAKLAESPRIPSGAPVGGAGAGEGGANGLGTDAARRDRSAATDARTAVAGLSGVATGGSRDSRAEARELRGAVSNNRIDFSPRGTSIDILV